MRAIDLAHPAGVEKLDNLVDAEARAGRQGAGVARPAGTEDEGRDRVDRLLQRRAVRRVGEQPLDLGPEAVVGPARLAHEHVSPGGRLVERRVANRLHAGPPIRARHDAPPPGMGGLSLSQGDRAGSDHRKDGQAVGW